MTENEIFVGKNKKANLTEAWNKSTEKFIKMEDEQTTKEVRKKAEKWQNKNKELWKRTGDPKLLEITNEIERYLRIFEKIERKFEDIVREVKKAYGTNKVDFSVYLIKVEHPCFHTDLGTNTVALNPIVHSTLKGSTIELTVPLKITWNELSKSMLGTKIIRDICTAYCYGDLYPKLEEHKEQLKSIRRISPIYLSRCKFDSHPHLTVEVGWDEGKKENCTYYSDLLDLKKIIGKTAKKDLPLQILRPITVEADRWEIIPLIIPVYLEEKHRNLIEDIKGKIELRLEGCGKVRLESAIKYEHEITKFEYSSIKTLEKIVERRVGGYDIKTINTLLKEQVFKADIEISCGIESTSGSGDPDAIENVMEERDEQYINSRATGMDPSCDVIEYIPEEIREYYCKEFDRFKERT